MLTKQKKLCLFKKKQNSRFLLLSFFPRHFSFQFFLCVSKVSKCITFGVMI